MFRYIASLHNTNSRHGFVIKTFNLSISYEILEPVRYYITHLIFGFVTKTFTSISTKYFICELLHNSPTCSLIVFSPLSSLLKLFLQSLTSISHSTISSSLVLCSPFVKSHQSLLVSLVFAHVSLLTPVYLCANLFLLLIILFLFRLFATGEE